MTDELTKMSGDPKSWGVKQVWRFLLHAHDDCRLADGRQILHRLMVEVIEDSWRQHVYWKAGEPDCPRDIKAANGELHTLRCKVCGREGSRGFCQPPPAGIAEQKGERQ